MTQMDDAARLRRAVPVASIDDADRLRPVDADKVQQIARSMAEVGLRNAIEVRPEGEGRWRLVSGAHRLAAARSLGLATIEAVIFEGTDDEARLAEIDENLFRHELNPLDEAVFLAERAEIYRRLHPETRHGGDRRKQDAKLASSPKARKFSDDVAERTGISARTVSRALTRFNRLSDEARQAIRGSEIARTGSALDFLCDIDPRHQARVARWALEAPASQPLAKRMASAKAAVLKVAAPTPPTPLERAWAAFTRLSVEEREGFLGRLQAEGYLKRRRAAATAPDSAGEAE